MPLLLRIFGVLLPLLHQLPNRGKRFFGNIMLDFAGVLRCGFGGDSQMDQPVGEQLVPLIDGGGHPAGVSVIKLSASIVR